MGKFYVLKDIGGGFDGLVAEGTVVNGVLHVSKITDKNVNVGDRNVSLPVPEGAIAIGPMYFEETDDPGIREFATDNPFGAFQLEGHMDCGNIKVHYAQYEKSLNVSVAEVQDKGFVRTIFSQNFHSDFPKVKDTIESVLKEHGGEDVDDLVFRLRELWEAQKNG